MTETSTKTPQEQIKDIETILDSKFADKKEYQQEIKSIRGDLDSLKKKLEIQSKLTEKERDNLDRLVLKLNYLETQMKWEEKESIESIKFQIKWLQESMWVSVSKKKSKKQEKQETKTLAEQKPKEEKDWFSDLPANVLIQEYNKLKEQKDDNKLLSIQKILFNRILNKNQNVLKELESFDKEEKMNILTHVLFSDEWFSKKYTDNYFNPSIRKLTFSSIKDEESSKKMYLFYYTLGEIFWNNKMHNIQSYVDTCGGNEEFSSYVTPILDNKIKLHWWLNSLSASQKSVFEKYWLNWLIQYSLNKTKMTNDQKELWTWVINVWMIVGAFMWAISLFKKTWWKWLLWLVWWTFALQATTWKWLFDVFGAVMNWWIKDVMNWNTKNTVDELKKIKELWENNKDLQEKLSTTFSTIYLFWDMKLSEIKWYINDGQFDISKLKEKYKEDPNKLKLLSNPKIQDILSKWFTHLWLDVKSIPDNDKISLSEYNSQYQDVSDKYSKRIGEWDFSPKKSVDTINAKISQGVISWKKYEQIEKELIEEKLIAKNEKTIAIPVAMASSWSKDGEKSWTPETWSWEQSNSTEQSNATDVVAPQWELKKDWWEQNNLTEQSNSTESWADNKSNKLETKEIFKESWYSINGNYYLVSKDWTPRKFEVSMLSPEVKTKFEKYQNFSDKAEDYLFLLEAYSKKFPNKSNLLTEFKSSISSLYENLSDEWVNNLNVKMASVIADIDSMDDNSYQDEMNPWISKNDFSLKEIFKINDRDARKLSLYKFVRENFDYNMVVYDLVESKFWDYVKEISDSDIDSFSTLFETQSIDTIYASAYKSEPWIFAKINSAFKWNNKSIKKFISNLYDRYTESKEYITKNNSEISKMIETETNKLKAQWVTNIDAWSIRTQAEKRIKYQFVWFNLKKWLMSELVRSDSNMFGYKWKDPYLKLLWWIEWIWTFDMSDRAKDLSKDILWMIAIEAVAFAVWAVTLGVWEVAIHAALAARRANRAREIYSSSRVFRWVSFVWDTLAQWFLFNFWTSMVHNIVEKNNLFKWVGDVSQILETSLFFWAMKAMNSLYSKVPVLRWLMNNWTESSYKKVFKLWGQVLLEWITIWWIANSFDIMFRDWEWTVSKMLEWIIMAMILKSTSWITGKLVARVNGWKVEVWEVKAEEKKTSWRSESEVIKEPELEKEVSAKESPNSIKNLDLFTNSFYKNHIKKLSEWQSVKLWQDITITNKWKAWYEIQTPTERVTIKWKSGFKKFIQDYYKWEAKELELKDLIKKEGLKKFDAKLEKPFELEIWWKRYEFRKNADWTNEVWEISWKKSTKVEDANKFLKDNSEELTKKMLDNSMNMADKVWILTTKIWNLIPENMKAKLEWSKLKLLYEWTVKDFLLWLKTAGLNFKDAKIKDWFTSLTKTLIFWNANPKFEWWGKLNYVLPLLVAWYQINESSSSVDDDWLLSWYTDYAAIMYPKALLWLMIAVWDQFDIIDKIIGDKTDWTPIN